MLIKEKKEKTMFNMRIEKNLLREIAQASKKEKRSVANFLQHVASIYLNRKNKI